MHSYSLDTDIRRGVYVGMGLAAFLLPAGLASLITALAAFISKLPAVGWPLSFGATFTVLFLWFDQCLWKWTPIRRLHGIPCLDGKWQASGVSSFTSDEDGRPTHHFEMKITIRQTFSMIEIDSETEDSTSHSTMASICVRHAVPVFRYAFENTPKNLAVRDLQRHPGLIELRIKDDDVLQGDYFSGKHRLRFGELTLRRVKS